MSHQPNGGSSLRFDGGAVVRRLATVLQGVELDCGCRTRLDQALARFEALENRRSAREQLATARRQRERIEAIFQFLHDLDALAPTEQDHGLYEEIALLFDDIAEAAAEGASAMRRLAASPVPPAML